MGAELTVGTARASREELEREMNEDGLDPRWWSNVFHTDDGDIAMEAGDRLDLEPGTSHSATVGPQGVVCVESPR